MTKFSSKPYINQRKKHGREFFGQFGEDIIIGNLLKNDSEGVYLDIGAYDPFRYSNTALLYEKGWTGINIDPNKKVIEKFNKIRPNDINLNLAVSDVKGVSKYYKFSKSAANTIEKSQIKEWTKRFGKPKVVEIKTDTVENILKEHKINASDIKYLNIDVEGHDFNILKSIDFTKICPKVITIEIHVNNNLQNVLNSDSTKLLAKYGYIASSYMHATAVFIKRD